MRSLLLEYGWKRSSRDFRHGMLDAHGTATACASPLVSFSDARMLGDISAELLLRGQALEVLRSDIDAFGQDVVLEVRGIVRHIQLKLKVKGGKNLEVTCHTDLTLKPSGCIIWSTYDPFTYSAVEYACLDGRPVRAQHRSVKYSTFEKFTDMADLGDGEMASDPAGTAVMRAATTQLQPSRD